MQRKIVRLGVLSLIIIMICLISPILWLRGGLFQEPVTTAISALRLEMTGDVWIKIDSEDVTLVRSDRFQDYLRLRAADGWYLEDQLGSGYVFKRGHESVILGCHLYSRRYKICSGGPQ